MVTIAQHVRRYVHFPCVCLSRSVSLTSAVLYHEREVSDFLIISITHASTNVCIFKYRIASDCTRVHICLNSYNTIRTVWYGVSMYIIIIYPFRNNPSLVYMQYAFGHQRNTHTIWDMHIYIIICIHVHTYSIIDTSIHLLGGNELYIRNI